jgi:hypothetical protein
MTGSLSETYLETVSAGDQDGAFSYSADGRSIAHSVNDVARFTLIDNIPAEAYGGSTVIN